MCVVVVAERRIPCRQRVRVMVVEVGIGADHFICGELTACEHKYVARDMTLETARALLGMDSRVRCDDCCALGGLL